MEKKRQQRKNKIKLSNRMLKTHVCSLCGVTLCTCLLIKFDECSYHLYSNYYNYTLLYTFYLSCFFIDKFNIIKQLQINNVNKPKNW